MSHSKVSFPDGSRAWVEAGDEDDPFSELAMAELLAPPGSSILGPMGEPGGPAVGGLAGTGDYAAYELLRRQVNGLTRVVDAAFVGHHTPGYAGNLHLINRSRSRSFLGQHLVDPEDGDDKPIPSALHLLQSIQATDRSVALNRSGFVAERRLHGSVSTSTMLLELRKSSAEGASDDGPWIGDARGETWAVASNGAYFSRGGMLLMGDTANAVLRGGSAFVEYGRAIACLGPGTSSDDASGTSIALVRLSGSTALIGDIYGNSIVLALSGSTSKFDCYGLDASMLELDGQSTRPAQFGASNWGLWVDSDTDELKFWDGTTDTVLGSGGGGGNEFEDDVFRINDETDPTKQLAFSVGGISAGTVRTLTVQDASGTIPLLGSTQSWTGTQTFLDSAFLIADNVDPTKLLALSVGAISAGTTRTITVPNASGTLPLLGSAQSWTAQQTFTVNPLVSRSGLTGNAVAEMLSLTATPTASTAAAGFGARIAFDLADAGDNGVDACALDATLTDATNGSADADLVGSLARASSLTECWRFTSQGALVMGEISTPATPASGKRGLYAKTDGWYDVDDAGAEKRLGAFQPLYANTTPATSMTYTVPAGTLAVDGEYLDIQATGLMDDVSETLRIRFGGVSIVSETVTTGTWRFTGRLVRTGSSAGLLMWSLLAEGGTVHTPYQAATASSFGSNQDLVIDYAAADAGDEVTVMLVAKVSAP